MKRKLEICCYTAESAIIAEKAGADRIELCDNHNEGGTTPSFASIEYCLEKVKIPVNVIVRPRGGDFLYSSYEFEIIKRDVRNIKKLGANGIVIGFLKSNGEIDKDKTKELLELAYPMEITFHRAFDMCKNPFVATEELIEMGVNRILTSGAKNKAIDGTELIYELIKVSKNRIIIMPGSGVNENNLIELVKKTNANEIHCSAKLFDKSRMDFINSIISMGDAKSNDEYLKISVDKNKIVRMVKILKSLNINEL